MSTLKELLDKLAVHDRLFSVVDENFTLYWGTGVRRFLMNEAE